MKRQTRVDVVVKGQGGRTCNCENRHKRDGEGLIERVPVVALVYGDEPSALAGLYESERETMEDRRVRTFDTTKYKLKPIEAVFDGTRFDMVTVLCHHSWLPSSLLDVPPIGRHMHPDDEMDREGYSSGHEMPGKFMARKEALQHVLDHNRKEEERWSFFRDRQSEKAQRLASSRVEWNSLYAWAVMVEAGQRIDQMETTAVVELCGAIGELRQELVYPVRVAKLTPEEVERYKIEVTSKEPAVV